MKFVVATRVLYGDLLTT